MTPLDCALIEKAGHDHGFEHVLTAHDGTVCLGSARHPAKVAVSMSQGGYAVTLTQGPGSLPAELMRNFAQWPKAAEAFLASNEAELTQWLQRASVLAQSLPNQAAVDFETQVQQALAVLPGGDAKNTEIMRMVRQRVGQDRFRQAMLTYWGGACAVTGLSLAAALRASHAKPWAQCATDAERLDVFNGFLLSANLDALFDQFLISFKDDGTMLISQNLTADDCKALGVNESLRLRWVAEQHIEYLKYHRDYFSVKG
jgi:hypothetical protein